MRGFNLIYTYAHEISSLDGSEAYTVNKPILGMIKLRCAQGYIVFDSGLFYPEAYVIFH